jgi:hypothetical protein
MKSLKEMLEVVKPYDDDYFNYVLVELKKAYQHYTKQDDFQDETFADMIDYSFFTMGHDSEDFERQLFNDYFKDKLGENIVNQLENDFCDNDQNDKHSFWFANYYFCEVIYQKLENYLKGE